MKVLQISRKPFERDKRTGLYLPNSGDFVGRRAFRDAAFTFRMGAGFAGEVNRFHPAGIEPDFPDATLPPNLYGQPVVIDATSHKVRHFTTTDTAVTFPYGVTVRPYPTQQPTAATAGAPATFNSGIPPTNDIINILRQGYILVQLGNGSITGAVKGGTVYVWCAASSGNDLQGSFTTSTTGGSVATLGDRVVFNGVEDSSGVVELEFNV